MPGTKGATVQFHNDKFANPAGLVEFIKAQGPAAKISGNKIVLMGEMKSESDRIKGAFNIARDLAEKIVKPKCDEKTRPGQRRVFTDRTL